MALRIARTCRALGIEPVAVYTPADRDAPYLRLAAEAHPLPADAPAESYLNIARLVEIARRAGADAVHPGYGFLAENPEFAAACAEAGLRFVGPPAAVLARCGDKAEARRRVAAAGVPVLPGTGPVSDEEVERAAAAVGYPLLIKAVGGGGGKGIHLVERPEALRSAVRLARGEAQAAFGDPRIYLERWLPRPRHVEVQVLADREGQVVHLGERDCSIQRRHQKVIEETPSPAVGPALRARLGEAAVRAAQALGYENAGTVEFLLDTDAAPTGSSAPFGEAFYCIEINARLQVEHPVTELVTGLDLVALQLHLAGGAPLPLRQEDVTWRGHAVECRVSAEDPHHDFLPTLGTVAAAWEPSGPGVRVDSTLAPGLLVTRHFDPLLAKVVTWGPDRPTAIARMTAALDEMAVAGVRTTLPFLRWAVRTPAFREGRYDVRFTEAWTRAAPDPEATELAVLAAALWEHGRRRGPVLPRGEAGARWGRAGRLEAVRREAGVGA
ncbi:MAG: biotin carboxylase N-terminal domain-containing protein [Armatimonadota bacterium]|nr:biotin carboxylase N-terminal domain-containing protein [Armatimonadota bacterium]MDR7448395.1 biotin carboxylase N-terminal domain-containing protein [Armatimonadota bacterium]MDR7460122.1 biotin carboxylase N-terminal domain-containing protein [Armatimonadota bacterium]MDR7480319.1 biotin carboxylase N-terminal domain-containing protein [Armatimonadota bacterium]MDR7528014.1 biotin carboxylase N-terminal domain-containing protein [Armatimonadota bacterium]